MFFKIQGKSENVFTVLTALYSYTDLEYILFANIIVDFVKIPRKKKKFGRY